MDWDSGLGMYINHKSVFTGDCNMLPLVQSESNEIEMSK